MTLLKIKRAANQLRRQSDDAVASESPKVRRPSRPPERWRWSFSFKYWIQIDHFGLAGIEGKWFASLLQRFQQLSGQEIDRVLKDYGAADRYRFHKINWSAKRIPISKTDLSHVPSHYLDSADYEFLQFQVSTSLGRVVGFFDEAWIFNIVLLDSLHNLQPSKDFDYRVTPSSPLSCEISAVRESIRGGLSKCSLAQCAAKPHLEQLASEADVYFEPFHVVLIKLGDSHQLETARAWVDSGKVNSLSEIFELGMLALES